MKCKYTVFYNYAGELTKDTVSTSSMYGWRTTLGKRPRVRVVPYRLQLTVF